MSKPLVFTFQRDLTEEELITMTTALSLRALEVLDIFKEEDLDKAITEG